MYISYVLYNEMLTKASIHLLKCLAYKKCALRYNHPDVILNH